MDVIECGYNSRLTPLRAGSSGVIDGGVVCHCGANAMLLVVGEVSIDDLAQASVAAILALF